MFQLISFAYYLTTMYPYSLDQTFLKIIGSHVALLIPPIIRPTTPIENISGKYEQTGLYGALIFDGQGVLIGYILLLVLALVPKLVKSIVDPRRNRSIFNACSWLL